MRSSPRAMIVACVLVIGACISDTSLRAQSRLQSFVLSSGAVESRGTGMVLHGTIGQVLIGTVTGTSQLQQGFWYQHIPAGGVNAVLPPRPGRGWQVQPGYPNPFRDASTITVLLERPQPLRVELCDQLGRVISTAYDSHADAGSVHIRIDGARLTPGLTYVRVTAGGDVRTLPLLRVR